jgi:two-component system sensor kinase FixL
MRETDTNSGGLNTVPTSLLPAIFESTSDAIISATVDGSILSWNSGAAKMFGYSADEIIGSNVSLIFPPDRHGEFSSAQQEIKKGECVEFESQRLRRDGSLLNVAVKLSPIIDETQRSVGITAIIRDITEQVRAKRVRTSQLKFEQLISELSANFINLPPQLIDREMIRALQLIGQFIGVDRSIIMLLSDDKQTLSCSHEWHNETVKTAKERLQRVSCIDSPWLMKNYLNGDLVVANDVSLLPQEADKEIQILKQFQIKSMLGIPLLIGGKVCGVACFDTVSEKRTWSGELIARMELVGRILANAIDRQQVDKALRESERRFRQLADSIDLVFWFMEVEPHKTIYISPAFENIWGIPIQQMYDDPHVWAKHIHDDDRERVVSGFEKWMAEDAPEFYEEYRIVRNDGTVRWILDTGTFLPIDESGRQRVSGVAKDITERKLAEQNLRQKEAELAHVARVSTMGEIAAELAHELNQPLHAIGNFAEVARSALKLETPEPDTALECLDSISEQANRSAEIIRRVKRYVRDTDAAYQDADLNHLIHSVNSLLSFDLRAHFVNVELRLDDNLPTIHADALRIEQVLVNLIRNAIDAMQETLKSHRKIVVTTRSIEPDLIEVQVCDSGRGLDEEALKLGVFEAFRTSKESGLGLGLSICRSTIEAHGGNIKATNSPGGGAVFSFSLPTRMNRHHH